MKERILTIRLLERLQDNPEYGKILGLIAENGPGDPDPQKTSSSA